MAADLGEFNGDDTESRLRSKRRSFATMGHDDTSSLAGTPITAPKRNTPPQTALASERPMHDTFITPSPSTTNSPGMISGRQFGGFDNDYAKAQVVDRPFVTS
jgi:hypothetical protein